LPTLESPQAHSRLQETLTVTIPADTTASTAPTSFSSPTRKARKRTSDEFEMDQSGSLISKRSSSSSVTKDKKESAARRHRSLGGATASGVTSKDGRKDRKRESVGLTLSSSLKGSVNKSERHSRHASASSTTNADRKAHSNTDFTYLPPSPSLQGFIRNNEAAGAPSPLSPPAGSSKELHHSPNVAHSLLRGTQEGWSGMDDEATAEALRKLDGISGKNARARSSVASVGRPSSSSRPSSVAKSGQRESGAVDPAALLKRRSTTAVNTAPDVVEPLQEHEQSPVAVSSDELVSSAPEKTPKKSGTTSTRSSLVAKRGSASSTTYTGTPSSRDSVTMSAGTSVTSVSAVSGRHSMAKARRNSAGSDISSVQSSDAASLKDRVASLATSEPAEEGAVPPVPPLPKNLSTYKSPPSTAAGNSFPVPHATSEVISARQSQDGDYDRTISLEVTSPSSDVGTDHRVQAQRYYEPGISGLASGSGSESATVAVQKTPSKKWSFTNALNLKLSHSPSSSNKHSSASSNPLSPRSVTFGGQLRKSISKEQGLSPSAAPTKSPWSPPTQPDAMASAASLASLSSVGSVRTPALVTTGATSSKTPDRNAIPSRSGTDSSASTSHNHAIGQPGPLSPTSSVRRGQSKRLTPSSIPFFRRSSSQSMQSKGMSLSPTFSTDASAMPQNPPRHSSPERDIASMSTSAPSANRKSSVFSLLRGSSSRKSLHSDSKEAARDVQKAKDAIRDAEKERIRVEKEKEREKNKKDDKDRSESRISVLMGRKRGKVS
jgi:dual specificity tyrosine-phosphorylation-regulated kinase 2/3/4